MHWPMPVPEPVTIATLFCRVGKGLSCDGCYLRCRIARGRSGFVCYFFTGIETARPGVTLYCSAKLRLLSERAKRPRESMYKRGLATGTSLKVLTKGMV